MSKLKNIQPTQLLVIALILVVAGILAFILRDMVREAVVIPLAYLAWFADLVLKSIPQAIFLALLLIAGIYIVLRGFAQGSESPDRPPVRQDTGSYRTRLGFWVRQLNHLEDSALAREKVAEEMRGLILSIVAHEESIDEDEIVQRVRAGSLSVPSEVKSLLLNGQRWMNPESNRPPSQLLRRLRAALPRSKQSTVRSSALDKKLEDAIEYVEAQVGGQR